ncbi:MAG: hypothetical protein GNW80_08025 [Asgard group archaeon]|nr:hypothetical protein [Asgard group archaeon]
MKKTEVFSLITNETRNAIIIRLQLAEKAAYSDLLDTVNHIHPLQSTGNLNYHLNFLIKSEVICKVGSIYKLTEKGKEITRFISEIDHIWEKIKKIIRGGNLSTYSFAEHFEDDTGHKMDREMIEFQGSEMIMDEGKIFGIITDFEEKHLSKEYVELNIEELKVKKLNHKQESGVSKTYVVLAHPKIDYYISPKYYGLIQDYIERNIGVPQLYAQFSKIAPFIIKAKNNDKKCYFVLAPSSIAEINIKDKKV